MTGWEYTTVALSAYELVSGNWPREKLQPSLDVLGKQGWELVGVCAQNGRDGQTEKIIATLKRPLSKTT